MTHVKNGMRPVHPGEILRDEVEAEGLADVPLSKALGVSLDRLTMILDDHEGLSAGTELLLVRYFGTTPDLWLDPQQTWELRRAEVAGGQEIARQVMLRQSAA